MTPINKEIRNKAYGVRSLWDLWHLRGLGGLGGLGGLLDLWGLWWRIIDDTERRLL